MNTTHRIAPQLGGTLMGFVGGLLLGLALALLVALYVTRSALPLEQRGLQNPATPEDAEAARNWNPNAALSARPAAAPPVAPADPLGQLIEQRRGEPAPAATAAATPAPDATTLHYYVQAGAFGNANEAQAQRARLAMLGFEATVSERRQDNVVVYRVRLGPFAQAGEAEEMARRMQAQGIETALVRVAR